MKPIDDLVTENPPEGRAAADAALALLAELHAAPPDLLAFGAQIDGSAWRANGNYLAAQRCYTRAEGIYCQALATCRDFVVQRRMILGQAELRRRCSFLCVELQEWERGLEMLALAERRFTLADQPHEVARVYLARGQLVWERNQSGDQDQALELLSLAVEMIDPRKSMGAFNAAEHNLTTVLTLHPDPAPKSLERAFEALQRGRLSPSAKRGSSSQGPRQRFGHSQFSIPDAKRRYLQGKILLRLRQPDTARTFLDTARTDLMALGDYPRDVFAVTLDLAECYLLVFKLPWRRVADLLTQTFERCPVSDVAPETKAALELLQTALEARSLPSARKHLDLARHGLVTPVS
ncbi:MAG: hypothetical protein GY856_33050 [bacterium]|nr:hypothetical protein [bacterium]